MPSRRRATTACVALVVVLLLFVATPATAAADEGTVATSFVDYFLGDMFHIPGQMEPKAPQFRPWKIFDVSGGGALGFDCADNVPTLHVIPHSDNSSNNGTLPANTCGGGGGTPVQYKFSRRDKLADGYSAMFWAQPSSAGDGEKKESRAAAPLMPLPKLQLKAIMKFLAAVMDTAWRGENGEDVLESVAFPADAVAFYVKEPGWLVVLGREDVEFHKPWGRLDGKISNLTIGAVA